MIPLYFERWETAKHGSKSYYTNEVENIGCQDIKKILLFTQSHSFLCTRRLLTVNRIMQIREYNELILS